MQTTAQLERVSPLAGKPAPREMLVDIGRLDREYYARKPDVGDPTQREAELSLEALRVALEQHPAGPLALKRGEVRRVCDGFDLLGYRFQWRKGELVARPTDRNIRRFRARMAAHYFATAIKGEGADQARNFIRSWCGQFELWSARARWKSMHLRDIDQAERNGDFIRGAGLDPEARAERARSIFSLLRRRR